MEAFNLFNIGLDVYTALLCLVMGAQALSDPGTHMREANRWFAGICISNAVMALGDITSWWPTPPLSEAGYVIVMAGSLLFYAAVVPVYLCFTGYLLAYLGVRVEGAAKLLSSTSLKVITVVFGAYLLLCVASLWTGHLFVVTHAGGYERGELFWLSQATVIVLHLYNTGIIIRNVKHMVARERIASAAYVLLPALADVIQVFCFGVSLLNTSIAFALLIMFINIQAERRVLLERRDKELAETRAAMMLSQIQPHFLYNTLTGIRELTRTDPQLATEAITDFATYLRLNMRSLTSSDPIPFETELEHARTYLMLEGKRYGERLRWDFDIYATDFALPPLTVQPLVENAVRHGIAPREEGGHVRVTARKEGGMCIVTVEDDGVGFDPTVIPSVRHVGIRNVRERVQTICDGELEIVSAPGEGTVARLSVPYLGDVNGGVFDYGLRYRGRR